jgi:ubiquinone/menaquinone biosynthesis C-methylase UbiE
MAGDAGRGDDRETERIRAIYDRGGVRLTASDGSWLLRGSREWLGSRARGETLEIGIGGGATMPHYPSDIRLTGVDVSPVMLAAARQRAVTLGRPVELRLGDASHLAFEDASFDTVVFCLVLCTVPDDRLAIEEAARVLRPGGRLLAVEHVRSPNRLVRWAERLWEPVSMRQAGDHLTRDPVDHLEASGFEIEALERLRFGFIERVAAVRRPARGAGPQ